MLMPANEGENALGKLAKAAARKALLAFAGAVGAKVGEKVVEWMFGGDSSDDEDDDEEKPS